MKSKPVARVAPLTRLTTTEKTTPGPLTKSQAKTLLMSLKSALNKYPAGELTRSKSLPKTQYDSSMRPTSSAQQTHQNQTLTSKCHTRSESNNNRNIRELNIVTPDLAKKTVAQIVLTSINIDLSSPSKSPITKNRSITFQSGGEESSSKMECVTEHQKVDTGNPIEEEELKPKRPLRVYGKSSKMSIEPITKSPIVKRGRGRPRKHIGNARALSLNTASSASVKAIPQPGGTTSEGQATRLSVSSQMKIRSALQKSFTRLRSSSRENKTDAQPTEFFCPESPQELKPKYKPRVLLRVQKNLNGSRSKLKLNMKATNLDKIIASLSQKAEVVNVVSPGPMSPVVQLQSPLPSRSSSKHAQEDVLAAKTLPSLSPTQAQTLSPFPALQPRKRGRPRKQDGNKSVAAKHKVASHAARRTSRVSVRVENKIETPQLRKSNKLASQQTMTRVKRLRGRPRRVKH